LRRLGDEHDIEALAACDGDRLVLLGRGRCQMIRKRSRATSSATCGFSSAQS
jgi:hypothetical protein